MGWDSTVSVGLGVGAGVGADASAGVGNSFSIPLTAFRLPGYVMGGIRLLFGAYKLLLDVTTGSPFGFLRDAMGILGPAADAAAEAILGERVLEPLVNETIPLPPGYGDRQVGED